MQYKAHRHTLNKPMQLSLCVVVLALSLGSILLGSRLFMASINQYRASSFLSDWESKRQVPTELAWQVAEQAMLSASSWYPAKHGAYAEQLGYMLQWRVYRANPEQAGSKDYQQQAIQEFRSASQLRPTWPYAWSGLAYAKLVANEFDQELTHAMQQAVYYGPNRIGINRRIAEVGLISWDKLNTELRELTLGQASRTARYSRNSRAELFTLAAEIQRVELLCEHLQDGIKPCVTESAPSTAPLHSISSK